MKQTNKWILGFVLMMVVLLTRCTTSAPTPTPLPSPTATATTTPTATLSPTPTPTPTLTPTPTQTPTPTPLSPEALFERYAKSLAFVDTPLGKGTGVLVQDHYVLTNAHVVLPFEHVRLTFPDKEEFTNVPVAHLDTLADLALLGPITTTLPSIALEEQRELPVGTEVYLLGYPGEVETFPKPTITRGLISRYRRWDALGFTFIQTDATVAGGQSGGILLTPQGDVLGISGYAFADRQYGLVLTTKDVLPRIQLMLHDEIPETASWVWTSHLKGRTTQNVTLRHRWAKVGFVIHAPQGTHVNLTFKEGLLSAHAEYAVCDAAGMYLRAGEPVIDGARDEFSLERPGPYYLALMGRGSRTNIAVESNVPLVRHPESSEDPLLQVGEERYGVLDYPNDVDVYRLVLAKGETVNIHVSALMIDPTLVVDLLDKPLPNESLLIDMDSGKGLFGTDAELTFTAPKRGTYALIVTDLSGSIGGYDIQVRPPYEGAPTPVIIQPTPTPLPSSIGPVRVYTSKTAPYVHIRYPANWSSELPTRIARNFCQVPGVTFCLTDPYHIAVLIVVEDDLGAYGLSDISTEEYAALWKQAFGDKFKIVREETGKTAQGLDAHVLEATLMDDLLRIYKLFLVKDGKGVTITFAVFKPDESMPQEVKRFVQNSLPKIIDYVFTSLRVE